MKVKTFKAVLLPVAAAAALVACGGDGSKTSSVALSGQAMNGYLEKAKVCIDFNANAKCDANEPSAMTDKDGAYKLPATADDAKFRSAYILVETTDDTKDANDAGKTLKAAGRKPFVLRAPVALAKDAKLNATPFTTAVSARLQAASKTADKATAEKVVAGLATEMGLSKEIMAGEDYYAKDTKNVQAQVQSKNLANLLAVAAEKAAAVKGSSLAQQVVAAANAAVGALAALPTSDKPADTKALEAAVKSQNIQTAVTQASSEFVKDVEALAKAGVYDVYTTSNHSTSGAATYGISGYSVMLPSSTAGIYKDLNFHYNASTKKYEEVKEFWGYVWSYDTKKWEVDGTHKNGFKVMSKTDYALAIKDMFGVTGKAQIREVNLEGKLITDTIYYPAAGLEGKKFDKTAVGYYHHFQYLKPKYKIHRDWRNSGASADFKPALLANSDAKCWDFTTGLLKAGVAGCTFASFDELIKADTKIHFGSSYKTAIKPNGVLVFYKVDSNTATPTTAPKMVEVGKGKYVIEDLQNGAVKILRATSMPDVVRKGSNMLSNDGPALYIYDGKVVQGSYTDTSVRKPGKYPSFNKAALNQILTNAKPALPAVK